MIAILIAFYICIGTFAIIGAMRGWAKELLVIFSVILALALITIIETMMPSLGRAVTSDPKTNFWVRTGILVVLAFFGYQSPKVPILNRTQRVRDRLSDNLLGFFMGALSGYAIIGSLWWFLAQANYFPPYIFPPGNDPMGLAAQRMVQWLPPAFLLGSVNVYIAVVIAFIFVIIVIV